MSFGCPDHYVVERLEFMEFVTTGRAVVQCRHEDALPRSPLLNHRVFLPMSNMCLEASTHATRLARGEKSRQAEDSGLQVHRENVGGGILNSATV